MNTWLAEYNHLKVRVQQTIKTRESSPSEIPTHGLACRDFSFDGASISHTFFLTSFCKSQFSHKFANSFFILVIVTDKLTDLLGNQLLQNDVKPCETTSPGEISTSDRACPNFGLDGACNVRSSHPRRTGCGPLCPMPQAPAQRGTEGSLQGYLAPKKQHPPRTLQYDYA